MSKHSGHVVGLIYQVVLPLDLVEYSATLALMAVMTESADVHHLFTHTVMWCTQHW